MNMLGKVPVLESYYLKYVEKIKKMFEKKENDEKFYGIIQSIKHGKGLFIIFYHKNIF